jgi:hypothetical protein
MGALLLSAAVAGAAAESGGVWAAAPWRAAKTKAAARKAGAADLPSFSKAFISDAGLVAKMPFYRRLATGKSERVK